MHPYDIPDESHPPVKDPEEFPTPGNVPPEWINAEALSAAVATAQQEATAGDASWSVQQILDTAETYRAFINGYREDSA